ncbi:MAG: VPS10 domain-containing protein [Chitinophagales bacterium]
MRLFFFFIVANFTFSVCAQINHTHAAERQIGIKKRKILDENSLVQNLQFRNVGPTVMSGRVTDVDVNPDDPTKFYVSYASGGLWYTENNGQSFTPIFDHEDVITIGDFAVDWKNNVIIVGTGEVNSSRSSYAGNGIYKSVDNGKNWQYLGLPESHHIGKVMIQPTNNNIIYVAALGHLYSANKDRGIYKTTDGGKTWKHVLYIDENTGGIDLEYDKKNPDILYASVWHRERRAWDFIENGKGGGIYKSTDGGESWKLITDASSGFPHGEGVGRIGLAVAQNNTNILYAIIDNQFIKPDTTKPDLTKLTAKQLKGISKEAFLILDEKELDTFLVENDFPKEFSSKTIKEKVKKGEWQPNVLNEYLNLGDYDFNAQVYGCEVYRSDDAGKTWRKTHTEEITGMFFTYGYYFSTMYVAPQNDEHIYILGFNLLKSEDGGKTFSGISKENVHPDHHALWLNPKDLGHIINGNDGGINITYDDGKTWSNANNPAVGQFYTVDVDNAEPYNVYGGLQDNGVWFGPSTYNRSNYWMISGEYPYKSLYGGDGMQVRIDLRDNQTVYTGYQFGFYARLKNRHEEISIRPGNLLGEPALRFNWQTPIWLSKHNQDVLYYGANKFFRSLNKGENLTALSPDLSNGKKPGNVPYGTITSIHESPKRFGLIYCGTDDGNVWLTKDGGYTWDNISGKLPQNLWVSRVAASAHNEGTVYVSLNGYRFDNFQPWLFASNDYGTSWTQIGTDLPFEPINVVKEDPKNKNIIYVGTDNGLYVSINGGKTFMTMKGGLPRVAVHDLAIQERENELVVGTHGRSIFIASLNEIQTLDTLLNKELFVFKIPSIEFDKNWGSKWASYVEPYQPVVDFTYFINNPASVIVSIQDTTGMILFELTDTAEAGLNYLSYHLVMNENAALNKNKKVKNDGVGKEIKQAGDKKYYLPPGKYFLKISAPGLLEEKKEFFIKEKDR